MSHVAQKSSGVPRAALSVMRSHNHELNVDGLSELPGIEYKVNLNEMARS